jgi:flagellar biosynthesis/type III secretory pathway chaperone
MTAMLDAFIKTLERLENVIDVETTALQKNQVIDLADFNHKKRHGLLELSRTMRLLDEESREVAQPDLHRLHDKVEKNLSILEIHIKAVHEVAAIIANAIQEHESDGTYSRWLASQGKG